MPEEPLGRKIVVLRPYSYRTPGLKVTPTHPPAVLTTILDPSLSANRTVPPHSASSAWGVSEAVSKNLMTGACPGVLKDIRIGAARLLHVPFSWVGIRTRSLNFGFSMTVSNEQKCLPVLVKSFSVTTNA